MGAQSIFIKILAVLITFNFLFYLVGWNSGFLDVAGIIGIFVGLGVITVIIAIIPFTYASTSIKWLMSTIVVVSIIYRFDFDILTYHLSYGIGLASSLSAMFNSNPNVLGFMPYLFFTFLGLIGLITGIVAMGGGGD